MGGTECGSVPNMYQRFIQSIQSGVNDQPDFARGAEIQELLDLLKNQQLRTNNYKCARHISSKKKY